MDDKLCLLVVISADDTGRKEVLAVDGYRESEASWREVFAQLSAQGVKAAPKLAVGDGALGFWNALTKHWPDTALRDFNDLLARGVLRKSDAGGRRPATN